MRCRKLLLLLCVTAAGVVPLMGAEGYVPASPEGCKIWTAYHFQEPQYVPRYSGACAGGKANGKGKLEWLNTYAEGKVWRSWDGYFQNGVFIGAVPLPEMTVEPVKGSYHVRLGEVKSGVVFTTTNETDEGVLNVCGTWDLTLVLSAKVPVADDDAVKNALKETAQKFQSLCPEQRRPIGVYAHQAPYELGSASAASGAVAEANFRLDSLESSGYQNEAANKVRQEKQDADRVARLAELRKRFDDFGTRNGVSAWVTASQLDKNPFKYEGKTVGTVVVLDRMISRDTAVVRSGLSDWGDFQLRGIDPDFPDNSHTVLLVGKVGKRETLPGDPHGSEYTTLVKVDAIVCAKEGCRDWLAGADEISWGNPWVKKPD